MKIKKCYIGTRDPKKGGLIIDQKSQHMNEEICTEITAECLEIKAVDYVNDAFVIYPLSNGEFSVSLAKKVKTGKRENREHEDIQGYVLSDVEFSEFLKRLEKDNIEEFFTQIPVDEHEDEGLEELEVDTSNWSNEDEYEEFLSIQSEEFRRKFFRAVCAVVFEGKHIQLLVPEELGERRMQAALYKILPFVYRRGLATVSNGDCTTFCANILLLDKGKKPCLRDYEKTYETLSLQEFVEQENYIPATTKIKRLETAIAEQWSSLETMYEMCDEILKSAALSHGIGLEIYGTLLGIIWAEQDEKYRNLNLDILREEVAQLEKKETYLAQVLYQKYSFLKGEIKEEVVSGFKESEMEDERTDSQLEVAKWLEKCKKYLALEENLEYGLVGARLELRDKKSWDLFQCELKGLLEETSVKKKQLHRFIQLLYLAFENKGGKSIRQKLVLAAPYDLEGMVQFLLHKKESGTKWERMTKHGIYKKAVDEMVNQYMAVFDVYQVRRKIVREVKMRRRKR